MTDGFHRRRGQLGAVATFTAYEADLLRSLAAQLIELVRDGEKVTDTRADPWEALLASAGPTTAPEDPVLARLLPSAYRDDDEAAGEFRRFTETELRTGKAGNAATVIAALEEAGLPAEPFASAGAGEAGEALQVLDVELDHDDAMAWLKSLTDMRLAIGVRLGIEEGDDERWDSLPEDDPRVHVHAIYDWLGYVQETLVRALSH